MDAPGNGEGVGLLGVIHKTYLTDFEPLVPYELAPTQTSTTNTQPTVLGLGSWFRVNSVGRRR